MDKEFKLNGSVFVFQLFSVGLLNYVDNNQQQNGVFVIFLKQTAVSFKTQWPFTSHGKNDLIEFAFNLPGVGSTK